jgi:hypothetical protein
MFMAATTLPPGLSMISVPKFGPFLPRAPRQAVGADSRPRSVPIAATMALEIIGPMPGTVKKPDGSYEIKTVATILKDH